MRDARPCFDCFCCFVWAMTMVLGCAYLVFWKNHSGWWFVLAVFLAGGMSCSIHKEKEDKNGE